MLSRRAAAENPPLSTTRTKAVRLVKRSMTEAPIIRPHWIMLPVIQGLSQRTEQRILAAERASLSERDAWKSARGVMSNAAYVSEPNAKISVRPSGQAIKRAAFGLALA